MNAITHTAAFSLFPRGTFEAQRNAVCTVTPELPRQWDALDKYARRGWKNERYIDVSEDSNSCSPFKFCKRWVGDKHTWTLPLDSKFANSKPDSCEAVKLDPFLLNGFSFVRSEIAVDNASDQPANQQLITVSSTSIPILAIKRRLVGGSDFSQCYTVPPECDYKRRLMIAWARDWMRMRSLVQDYLPESDVSRRHGSAQTMR